jgi:hypothetical protein
VLKCYFTTFEPSLVPVGAVFSFVRDTVRFTSAVTNAVTKAVTKKKKKKKTKSMEFLPSLQNEKDLLTRTDPATKNRFLKQIIAQNDKIYQIFLRQDRTIVLFIFRLTRRVYCDKPKEVERNTPGEDFS